MSFPLLPKIIDAFRYLEIQITGDHTPTTQYSGWSQNGAEFWYNHFLKDYQKPNYLKFWKPIYKVEVYYYTCAMDYHTFTFKIQEK